MQDNQSEEGVSPASSGYQRFSTWLNHQQWVSVVLFLVGVGMAIGGVRYAFYVLGVAVASAGLFPVVTGVYRSHFGTLRGWKARLRGLVSVALGVAIFFLE